METTTNSTTVINYDNCHDTFMGLPCKDPSQSQEFDIIVKTLTDGFYLAVTKDDVEDCQRKLKEFKIRQIQLDVLNPEWQDCYFWIDSDKEYTFKMYLWPTSWLGFSGHKDGWTQYSNSVYDVATFLENTKKDINEYFLAKTL